MNICLFLKLTRNTIKALIFSTGGKSHVLKNNYYDLKNTVKFLFLISHFKRKSHTTL